MKDSAQRRRARRNTQRQGFFRSRQLGQILPIAVVGIGLLAVAMVYAFHTTRATLDKSRIVNAADAAAYSAAIEAARHMNTMAYLNRGMSLNAQAGGLMVSYASWAHTVADVMDYFKGGFKAGVRQMGREIGSAGTDFQAKYENCRGNDDLTPDRSRDYEGDLSAENRDFVDNLDIDDDFGTELEDSISETGATAGSDVADHYDEADESATYTDCVDEVDARRSESAASDSGADTDEGEDAERKKKAAERAASVFRLAGTTVGYMPIPVDILNGMYAAAQMIAWTKGNDYMEEIATEIAQAHDAAYEVTVEYPQQALMADGFFSWAMPKRPGLDDSLDVLLPKLGLNTVGSALQRLPDLAGSAGFEAGDRAGFTTSVIDHYIYGVSSVDSKYIFKTRGWRLCATLGPLCMPAPFANVAVEHHDKTKFSYVGCGGKSPLGSENWIENLQDFVSGSHGRATGSGSAASGDASGPAGAQVETGQPDGTGERIWEDCRPAAGGGESDTASAEEDDPSAGLVERRSANAHDRGDAPALARRDPGEPQPAGTAWRSVSADVVDRFHAARMRPGRPSGDHWRRVSGMPDLSHDARPGDAGALMQMMGSFTDFQSLADQLAASNAGQAFEYASLAASVLNGGLFSEAGRGINWEAKDPIRYSPMVLDAVRNKHFFDGRLSGLIPFFAFGKACLPGAGIARRDAVIEKLCPQVGGKLADGSWNLREDTGWKYYQGMWAYFTLPSAPHFGIDPPPMWIRVNVRKEGTPDGDTGGSLLGASLAAPSVTMSHSARAEIYYFRQPASPYADSMTVASAGGAGSSRPRFFTEPSDNTTAVDLAFRWWTRADTRNEGSLPDPGSSPPYHQGSYGFLTNWFGKRLVREAVQYSKDAGGVPSDHGEYANLFAPFWEARLITDHGRTDPPPTHDTVSLPNGTVSGGDASAPPGGVSPPTDDDEEEGASGGCIAGDYLGGCGSPSL